MAQSLDGLRAFAAMQQFHLCLQYHMVLLPTCHRRRNFPILSEISLFSYSNRWRWLLSHLLLVFQELVPAVEQHGHLH